MKSHDGRKRVNKVDTDYGMKPRIYKKARRQYRKKIREAGKEECRKASGAKFCWLCSRKLRLPHFTKYVTEGGQTVKVHKICKDEADQKFVEEFDGDRRGFWEDE